MKLSDIKFTAYLGVISILGFLTILLDNAVGIDIEQWVEGALFFIIGLYLFVAGGYKLIFTYFKGGLTAYEMNKIVSVVVGVASMFVGLLTSPLLGVDFDVFAGIKVIISLVAIVSIALEMFSPDGCKR